MNGQEISQKNSDNRKKLKTKHIVGSKSYSQLSFEQRNLETGEEPDCIALWELAHMKNGTWLTNTRRLFMTKHVKRFKTKKMKLKVQFQVNKEAIFSRLHTKTL
uniref:Uncharacterized protein n=1 Tax=Avena sativa TaxID=4498 RepID=A0ACD5WZ61_AVESA